MVISWSDGPCFSANEKHLAVGSLETKSVKPTVSIRQSGVSLSQDYLLIQAVSQSEGQLIEFSWPGRRQIASKSGHRGTKCVPALGPREIRHQVAHGQEEESEGWRRSPCAWEEVTAHREPVQHECRPGSGRLPGAGLLVTPPTEQAGTS